MRNWLLLPAILTLMLALATPAAANPDDVPLTDTDTLIPDFTQGMIDCGSGVALARVIKTEAEWIRFGKTSAVLTADKCTLDASGTIVVQGQATRTFANGDQYPFGWVSIVTPGAGGTGSVLGAAQMRGGTGIFAQASAYYSFSGKIDLTTGVAVVTNSGTMFGVGQPATTAKPPITPPSAGDAGLASDNTWSLYAGIALIFATATGTFVLARARR
jgi:hypothetical protein